MKLFRVFSFATLLTTYLITQSLSAQLIYLTSSDDFKKYLQKKEPMVVDFFTTWCGVCTRVKPMVEQLARKHSDINFILIDGDKFPDLRKEYQINAFPTFIFLDLQGKEQDRIRGREKPERMDRAINKIREKKEAPMMADEPKPIKQETKKPEPIKEPAPEKKMPAFDKNVIELASLADLEAIRTKGQPMMYDFYTVWCGPCKQMKPMIENELSKEYPDVIFVTIDAEKFPSLETQYKVKGYPTFVFLDAKGNEVTRLSGGCPKMLMQGKLNQISSKKTGLIVMDEKEMMAKMQAEGKMMPQPQPQKQMPVEAKSIKTKQPKVTEKKVSSKRYKRSRK